MKRLEHKALVLVMDGSRAMLLRNDGTIGKPMLVTLQSFAQDNPPTHEQGQDRPARAPAANGTRAAIEAPDLHQRAEDQFVAEVTAAADAEFAKGHYTSFILAAPPTALAVFRQTAPASLKNATLAEINKDLTKHEAAKIAEIITKEIEAD